MKNAKSKPIILVKVEKAGVNNLPTKGGTYLHVTNTLKRPDPKRITLVAVDEYQEGFLRVSVVSNNDTDLSTLMESPGSFFGPVVLIDPNKNLPRLCVECLHHREEPRITGGLCASPVAKRFRNVVTGEGPSCHFMREETKEEDDNYDRCGLAAYHWTSKPTKVSTGDDSKEEARPRKKKGVAESRITEDDDDDL